MNVLEDEQLVAYWGQGLDRFVIRCLTAKKIVPFSKYINIYYKGYVFSKVVFYVYTTNVEIIGGEIALELIFISKFARIPATLHVTTECCDIIFAHRHQVRHVSTCALLRELECFARDPSRRRLRKMMVRVLDKSEVLLSVGILTKIVYFMSVLKKRRNGVKWCQSKVTVNGI
jgi:hypothetical protein